MIFESTNGKCCIKGAMIEVQPQGNLFKDISVCGDWCCEFSIKYNTCIHSAIKQLEIESLLSEE